MLEFSIILLVGIIAGVLIGLLPGLPAYIGPLVLLPWVSVLSVDQILAFWLASHIGSQYFGSVAAILLKIPGEASSLVYIRDLNYLDTAQRLDLVRQTAWGSTLGTIFAMSVLFGVYYLGAATGLIQLTSNNIKLSLLLILMLVMCWSTQHRSLSFLLFFVGFFFAEKSNHELPMWVFKMQEYTTDLTLFSLILGMLIIPEFIKEATKKTHEDRLSNTVIQTKSKLDLAAMFRGSWIGSLIGLVPGPSHILSGIVSYNSYPKQEYAKKIISAESANNSSTITSLLPFLYIGLPITLSEFLLNDLLQVKMFTIPGDFKQPWNLVPELNLIETMFGIIIVCTIVYHFLAQRFLNFYEQLMHLAYGKLKFIFISLIAYLIYIDLKFNPVYLVPYFIILAGLTWVGYKFMRKDINVLPLIFGFILGDMLAWAFYQFYQLNLS
jgi:putative tricarboxylic transport membrane protein